MSKSTSDAGDGRFGERPGVSVATVFDVFKRELRGLDVELCVIGGIRQSVYSWEVKDLNSDAGYTCFPASITYAGLVQRARCVASAVRRREEERRLADANKPVCPVCPVAVGGVCARCRSGDQADCAVDTLLPEEQPDLLVVRRNREEPLESLPIRSEWWADWIYSVAKLLP